MRVVGNCHSLFFTADRNGMISGPRFAVPLLLAASSWLRTRRPPGGRGEPGNPTVNIVMTRCARLRRAGDHHKVRLDLLRPAVPGWQSPRGGNLDYSSGVYREGPGRRRPMIDEPEKCDPHPHGDRCRVAAWLVILLLQR
jgi:hypothetical protein